MNESHPALIGLCASCMHPLEKHFGGTVCSACSCRNGTLAGPRSETADDVVDSIKNYLDDFPEWEQRLPSGLVGRLKALFMILGKD